MARSLVHRCSPAAVLSVVLLAGCGSTEALELPDAGPLADLGLEDGGTPDTGVDLGTPDLGPPEPEHCRNGTHDAEDGETDVDCGGLCRGCGFGQACIADPDCEAGLACGSDGICDVASCEDGALNGGESDIDCGGPICFTRCSSNQGCAETSDCDEALCVEGVCDEASCGDGILNGDESDVDCGGSLCEPCDLGEVCLERRDCLPDYEDATECRSEQLCSSEGTQDVRFEVYGCSANNRCVREDSGLRRDEVCERDLSEIRARPDLPDLANVDANCDGIDGEVDRSIFVSLVHGTDGADGRAVRNADGELEFNPVRTLQQGIDLALECQPSPCTVLVAEGSYDQDVPLRLGSGVDLYGGYAQDWRHDPLAHAVRIGASVSPTVHADGIADATIVADVVIRGPDLSAPAGAESIAVLVTASSTSAFVFHRSRIEGGRGAPGAQGQDRGHAGSRAGGGGGGTVSDCAVRGGGGGGGTHGGGGGGAGRSYCIGICPLTGSDGISDGGTGVDGGNGANGSRAGSVAQSTTGRFEGIDWIPARAGNGADGQAGGGGGGGGGGGSKEYRRCFCSSTVLNGGRGGRGGDGGRAGLGGLGGGQGGGSFAVVVVSSTVAFDATTLRKGEGGAGGRGGHGRSGEAGLAGHGGGGRQTKNCAGVRYHSGSGGRGGNGGGGGGGAGGAGGNGGPSFGLVRTGAITRILGNPIFEEAGEPGSGGAGGSGGRHGHQNTHAPSGPVGARGGLADEVQL